MIAEVVVDRQGKISRNKVVVMFKTPKAPVTPGLRPGYDLPATEKCWNRGQIVERTYRLVAEVARLVAEVVGDRRGRG